MSEEIVVLHIQNRGMPGTGISDIEKAQITNDISTLLNRPVIVEMSDLADVDTSGAGDGDALVFDLDTSQWVPGTVQSGISDAYDYDGVTETKITGPFTELQAWRPITFLRHPTIPNRLRISVAIGTGPWTVAAGDHAHNNPLPVFQPFAASGYMSGGSRQVVAKSVTLVNGISYVVIARFRPQLRGADENAAYYTLSTTIAGDTKISTGGATSGFWCVQGVPNKEEWVHARTIVGTGTSISVSASVAYHSGAGFHVDSGELEIELKPAR